MGLPCIWWLDHKEWKELLYKGDKIHLDQLRAMFVESEQTIIKLWEEKVLKGLKMCVSYDHLAESMENNEASYSFLTDPCNTCFSNHNDIANAFMANPTIRDFFGHLKGRIMTWAKEALLKWL